MIKPIHHSRKSNKSLLYGFVSIIVVALVVGGVFAINKLNNVDLDTRSDASVGTLLYPVGELPAGNLIQNPWFRSPSCDGPSFEGWTSDPNLPNHKWTASDKPSNPSPVSGCGTSGRVSVGEDGAAATVIPNQDVRMYQVVSANAANKYLTFDMYYVLHTVNISTVTVYGSSSPSGPWTKVWTPFSYSKKTDQVVPPAGSPQSWIWKCYSDHYPECADAPKLPVSTTLSQGYPYYKLEFLTNLPPVTGGYKQGGIFLSATSGAGAPPPPAATIPPKPTVTPSPKIVPGVTAPPRPGSTGIDPVDDKRRRR